MALPALSDPTAHAPPDLGASERLAPLVKAGRLRSCAELPARLGEHRSGREVLARGRMVAKAMFVAVVPSARRPPIITVACDGW
jgi:hypothetical protein